MLKVLKSVARIIFHKARTIKFRSRNIIFKTYNLLPIFIKVIILTNAIRNKNKKLVTKKSISPSLPFSKGKHCFAAQPEYFRQTYYDMLGEDGVEFPVSSLDKSNLVNLKKFCIDNNVKNLWLFRPEFFTDIQNDLSDLRNLGITILCYSTEPIPSEKEFKTFKSHYDQLKRLQSLLDSKKINYDFFIHFDQKSLSLLSQFGFSPLLSHPLPVSFKLFKPENLEKKFDVCFIGRSTDYRERFLAPLKSQFNTLHIAHGIFDYDASVLMNQSRIVLNLHNEPYSNFETRVVQAKLINSLLISEPLSLDYISPKNEFIEIKSPAELYETVKEILKNPDIDHPIKYNFQNKNVFSYMHLVEEIQTFNIGHVTKTKE